MLNEYNENTKSNIHLMVTGLCDRKCKHCCNNQYGLNDIPYVTNEELKNCKRLFLTGGEPVVYSDVNAIAVYYTDHYPNIEGVYVYANAKELYGWRSFNIISPAISGFTISVKTKKDAYFFKMYLAMDYRIKSLPSNIVYVFDDLLPKDFKPEGFTIIPREWQEEFVPAPDSVFRRI